MNTGDAVQTLFEMLVKSNNDIESKALHRAINALLKEESLSEIKFCPHCGREFIVVDKDEE